jgi:hypothetical protein
VWFNTTVRDLRDALAQGIAPIVVYYADNRSFAYGAPALPTIPARTHAGGDNPNRTATGETREDPFAQDPIRPGGDAPSPVPPAVENPNKVYGTAHAATITGIVKDTDGTEYITVIEPVYGERVWRLDHFVASWHELGRQAVLIQPVSPPETPNDPS